MAMDVKRDPAILRRKKIRRAALWGLAGVLVVVVSVALMQLKPAAPSVPYNTLWFGVVQRGSMLREVRGAGTLVPEKIRWITASASGRVSKIVLRPGAQVQPGTVILRLSNPDLEAAAANAKVQLQSTEAQLASATSNLDQSIAAQRTQVANAESAYKVAQANLTANQELLKQGIVSPLQVQRDQAAADQARGQWELSKQTLRTMEANRDLTLAPQRAAVELQRTNYEQVARQVEDLQVRSSMSGQLQLVQVEEGAQVAANANLARVSDPTNLKAQIRISETQTRDLAVGQRASIDTRNGIVKGRVSRIDPASQGGTVGVDVELLGPLPAGARPDLSVDGVIELERLENVLYVQHPTSATENSRIALFRVLPNPGETAIGTGPQAQLGREAVQTPVRFGRSSVQYIEVVEGLKEGDHVILSDMSQYDGYDRIRITG